MAPTQSKRYPKLRFALITEDALEKLRPEHKDADKARNKDSSNESSPVGDAKELDMYETINKTVNTLLEQKLQQLKLDKLDQLIERKVCEINERQRRLRSCSLRASRTPKLSASEVSIKSVSEFKHSMGKIQSSRFGLNHDPKRVRNAKRPSGADSSKKRKKKHQQSQHQQQQQERSPLRRRESAGKVLAASRTAAVSQNAENAFLAIAARYFKNLDERNKQRK
ncbi:uncharacterized protein LOC108605994 [Drosophila busckii]|uniref:uncharacterized protein LOC108605994 n=1 Tax=Drosophila busckii TaxID=30019 RepID=UPI00083F1C02|nr:uncharacterized protein LOC108605994 [Drosophila busckii]